MQHWAAGSSKRGVSMGGCSAGIQAACMPPGPPCLHAARCTQARAARRAAAARFAPTRCADVLCRARTCSSRAASLTAVRASPAMSPPRRSRLKCACSSALTLVCGSL